MNTRLNLMSRAITFALFLVLRYPADFGVGVMTPHGACRCLISEPRGGN